MLLFGAVSDVIGRRVLLAAGVVLAGLGTGLLAFPVSVGWLIAARAIQGLALGLAMGPATAALTELEPRRNPYRAAVYAAMAFVAGTGAGPLLTGLLAQYAPAPMTLPYLAMLGLIALSGPMITRLPGAQTATCRRRLSELLRSAWPRTPHSIRIPFALATANGALAWAVAALYLALAPSLLARSAQDGNLAVVGGVVAALFACSTLTQHAARHTRPRVAQVAGLGLLPTGLAALVAAGQTHSLTAMFVAAVLSGSGHGLAFSGALAEANALAPPAQRGSLTAALYVVVYAGVAFPVIGVGVLATQVGLLPAVRLFAYLAGAACLVSLAALILEARSRRCPGQRLQPARSERDFEMPRSVPVDSDTGPTAPIPRKE